MVGLDPAEGVPPLHEQSDSTSVMTATERGLRFQPLGFVWLFRVGVVTGDFVR